MIRFKEEEFFVTGSFKKKEEEHSVGIKLKKKEKHFFLDGAEKKRNADLLENVYIVVFSPEDIKIIKEDPEKRRKFINRELFQLKPLYYVELNRYNNLLKNRNILLKEETPDEDLLLVFDEYLAESGAKIMHARADFLKKLAEISEDIAHKISGGKETLSLAYEPKIPLEETHEKQKTRNFETLKASKEKDILYKSTSQGPHKDDVKIFSNGIDLRIFGSQGQQRTAALSLKLAEVTLIRKEKGEEPIILLDDVFSELDEERQNFLTHTFSTNQLFITAADLSEKIRKAYKDASLFHVKNGHIY
jgi:DNA replication and repair protein RecF